MGSKDIEGLVDIDEVLELGGKVARDTRDKANDDGRVGTDVARRGGDTDQTRDGTRAEPDSREFTLQPPVEDHPRDTTDGSREVGDNDSLDSAEVGTESRPAVEPKPTDPEEGGTDNDECRVVGLVGETLGTVSPALTEVESDSERGSTGRNVDGGSTGIVERTELGEPAVRVPLPRSDGAVDDGDPDEEKDHDGANGRAFGEPADGNDTGDAGKHVLEDHEEAKC